MIEQKFKIAEYHRDVPDDELISDVQRVARDLGKDKLTIDEYNDRGKYHATTLTRRFSSWFNVLARAGLKRTRNLGILNEELFENLVEVWTKLGRQPRYSDLSSQISRFSSGTYEKRFGGWRNALLAFSDWANDEERPPPESSTSELTRVRNSTRNINWRLRAQVLMRDSATCRLCGRSPADGVRLHVDHVVPWSKGGETALANLQILCEQCNVGKSDMADSPTEPHSPP